MLVVFLFFFFFKQKTAYEMRISDWSSDVCNASTAPKSGGPMRAVIVGAVESTRVTLQALADAPGWEAAALITLPPELAARYSDFVDMSAPAAEAGPRVIHAAASTAPDLLQSWLPLAPHHGFFIGGAP